MSTESPRLRVSSLVLVSLCASSGLHATGAAQIPPQLVPHIAQSAGAATGVPGGHFEDTSIPGFQYQPNWPSWTMGPGTGIANNGSGFTFNNPPAPEGTYVAFVQGAGVMSRLCDFPPGVSRLRFFGAQRKMGGVANRQVLRVSFGTTEVFEAELSGTDYAIYTTRALRFVAPTQLQVTFEGLAPYPGDHTALLDQVEVEPIAPWLRTSTWNLGTVPGVNDEVIIPAGVEVALRGTASAATVSVEGELVTSFDSATLDARWVAVGGTTARLEVGRELTPFEQDFTLTLTGLAMTEDAMGAGSKFLMAMDGGTIDLHGEPMGVALPDGRQRTWTRLAHTVTPPFSKITLTEPVPWEVGDEIVIAGSNQPDSSSYEDHAEKRVITATNGLDLTLADVPLDTSFPHFGATAAELASIHTYANSTRSWTFDHRAEVGLLSHNVRVRGDDLSEGPDQFGGHVMLMKGPCCGSMLGGRGRFSNVEFHRMGQKQELGRYPMHWHMQHDQGAGQFLKSCSVHESYNRAVTIHGSESLVIEGNVAYDHVGHGIFLEDGSERFNQLYHNLVLSTIKPEDGDELIPSDNSHDELQNRTPATFWITNPNNELVGNVAAGTIGTGFWFIFPEAPLGLSGNPAQPWYSSYFLGLQPDHEPLGLFAGNACHSSSMGFDVNDGIDPVTHEVATNHAWNPPGSASQYLDGLTVHACHTGLYSGSAGSVYERIRFREAVLGDNFLNILFAGYNVIEDSAVVAHSVGGSYVDGAVGYVAYDGAGRVFDSHFVGFDSGPTAFLGEVGAATRHTYHRFHGLSFDPPGPPRIELPDYASALPDYDEAHDLQEPRRWGITIVDEDGSLLGPAYAGRTLVSNHPMIGSSSDVTHASWVVSSPPNHPSAYLSLYSFAHLRLDHPGWPIPTLDLPAITLTRYLAGHPREAFLNDYNTDAHKQFPIVVNPPGPLLASYSVDWPSVPYTQEVVVTLDDLIELPDGTSARLVLVVSASATGFGDLPMLQVTQHGVPVPQFGSLAALDAAAVTGYFIDSGAASPRPLWLRLVKPSGAMTEKVRLAW